MQFVTWMARDEHIISNSDELMQVTNDLGHRNKVNAAFAETAERLGIGRKRKEEVVDYIETMARELVSH